MSIRDNLQAINFERNLINDDINFYYDFMSILEAEYSAPVLILGMLPYLSLFMVETYQYIQKNMPRFSYELSTEYENIIRTSRTRIKLFDTKTSRVEGSLELLKWVVHYHKDFYINSHQGYLAELKKSLQPDLGIFVCGLHIVNSTHTGIFLSGMDSSCLSEESEENIPLSLGYELGRYLRYISEIFSVSLSNKNNFKSGNQFDQISYIDVKSYDFLPSVFNGPEYPTLNLSLLLFISIINYLKFILNKKISIASIHAAFKIKYISLYHIASSIKKLQNYSYQKNILLDSSKEYFQLILKDKDLKMILSKIKLRNILVHYELKEIPEELIFKNLDLEILIEYFFDGYNFSEIDNIINVQINRISEILEQWLNWPVRRSQLTHLD